MKCPKCAYLGFETGERCRNCGYNFSLISMTDEPAADLSLRFEEPASLRTDWLEAADRTLAGSSPEEAPPAMAAGRQTSAAAVALNLEPTLPPPSFRGEPALPLFGGHTLKDDEPLIKVPSAPRPPLSVRRTPDTPRLRAVSRPVERPREPELDFADTPAAPPSATSPPRRAPRAVPEPLETSGAGARLLAAAIDHAILLAIDAVVLYLTLSVASLTLRDWRALPLLPLVTFLGLVKLAYFTAFTYVGGQTIGKMAAHIRVVTDQQRSLDAPHAIHRALAGAISFLMLGLGFLPALFGSERRALHDRLAHTRVVVLPTA